MSLFSSLKNTQKRILGFVAMLLTSIAIPTTILAWGPIRSTYTIEKPAPHVTFNSITNNPNYGDERNFVTIKDASNQNAGGWVDQITVQDGKEYYVRMYVHNNAAENLNLVANNVTAKFNVPTYNAKKVQIDGYLSADNAQPKEIWDQAVFASDQTFNLSYVAGSATYTNNIFTDGTALTDEVIGNGVKLGYETLDGKIPGCFQFSGLVIFKVKATTTDFSLQKTVRLTDSTDRVFKESVKAKPGEKVDFQIYFKNTGGTQLKNVVIKDKLPAGLEYVAGSSKLFNSDGLKDIVDGITTTGVNIGGYMPNGDAYLMFTAKVVANDKLPICGSNKLTNKAEAITSNGTKEDTAEVLVDRYCEPNKEPEPPVKPEPPVIPEELPVTGPSEIVSAFLGLGSLVTSAGYYINSRRNKR